MFTNIKDPESYLADLTDSGYRTAVRMVQNLIQEVEAAAKEGDLALSNAAAALRSFLDKSTDREVLLALLGEMSSGKSSLINAAIGYPLFPVAKVTTSACPAEIRYGKNFKLQVFTCGQNPEKDQEEVIFTFDNPQMLSLAQRKALLEYAQGCVTSKILVCENFNYYFDIRNGLADLDNVLHCGQLLITLLNGYVGQDYENVSQRRQKLIQDREALFQEIFGISASTSIGIRIWIDSSILKHGLTLVDLPGLGSDAKSHNQITTSYINKADCCVLLFGLDGNAAENRAALELMQDYEIMRYPGKSNRFILAVNKCDIPYEENDLFYADSIEQAVQSICDTLHSIEIREIVPLSARYAEYRFVRNGIPPENTILGRKLQRGGSSQEAILARLRENYALPFEYTDSRSDTLVSYSTQQFLEQTIGEYGIRIRYLNLARSLSEIADIHQEALNSLLVEAKMIALLEVLGSDLMKDLMGRMTAALKQTQVNFLDHISQIQEDMDARRLELAGMLTDEVIPAYEEGLSKADKDLNDHMLQEVGRTTTDFFGHVCIDEKDDRSKANKLIFDSLKDYFTKFNFHPYLKSGNALLQDYLDRQRSSYADGVDLLAGCFRALPGSTDAALEKAFQEFLESDKLKTELNKNNQGAAIIDVILNIYRKCFDEARSSINKHLFHLSAYMIGKIYDDDHVDKEINTTVSQVFTFFNGMIDHYHIGCAKYLSGNQKFTFFNDRPYLNINSIKSQISIPFTTVGYRKEYVGNLNTLLVGQDPASHNSRMENALKNAFDAFLQEASRKIGTFLPIVSDNIQDLFDASADKIRYRYLHIDESIQVLQNFLDGVERNETICQIFGQGYGWAEADMDACKQNLRQTGQLLETVRGEVRALLQRAEADTTDTIENAPEGTDQV